MEALKTGLKLDLVHVPYKGTGQSVPALLGGQVPLLYATLPSIESHVKAGRGFRQLGIDPVGSTPEAYNAANRASFEKYAKVVQAAGVKIE
jgi:tripartite-type tricarboxylate transporter receptor subunit TctC